MRENRQSGSEGGGTENNRFSLPLSGRRVGWWLMGVKVFGGLWVAGICWCRLWLRR